MFGWRRISEETVVRFQPTEKGEVTMVVCLLMWFAQTLRVLSRLITRRIFLVSLCCSRRTSPVPRSFHSDDSVANRKSFARLGYRAER